MESHLETKQIKISTVAIQTCWPVGKKRRWRLHSAVSKARDLRNASNWPSRSNWQRKIAIWGFRIIFWPRKTKKAIFWSLFTICLPILDLFGWGGTPKVVEITSKQSKIRRECCLTVCLYQTFIMESHFRIFGPFLGRKRPKKSFFCPIFGASGSPVFPGQVRDHLRWFSGCPSQELRFEGSWSDVGPTVPEIWPFAQKLFLSAKGQNSTFPKWWFYHFGAGGPARVVQITWNNSKWAASDAYPVVWIKLLFWNHILMI